MNLSRPVFIMVSAGIESAEKSAISYPIYNSTQNTESRRLITDRFLLNLFHKLQVNNYSYN